MRLDTFESRRRLVTAVALLTFLVCGCSGGASGGPVLTETQSGGGAAHNGSFALAGPGLEQTPGLGLSVDEQPGQVLVSIVAERLLSPDAVLFELGYDAARYTPQVVQATDSYCAPADSLTLEMLATPGTVSFGQVPVGTAGNVIEPGAVLAEVLFTTEPYAVRAATDVPVHSGALCPLTYDADSGALTLHYVNPGDYDQNGVVSASDLVPIGRHYAEAGPFDFHSALSVIDGNSNGQIDVADITVIGQYWGNDVEGFNFYGSNEIDDVPVGYAEPSTITPLGYVDFHSGSAGIMPVTALKAAVPGNPATDRLCFTFIRDTLDHYAIYWARPTVGETEGICSNLAGPEMITQLGSQSNALPAAMLNLDYTGLDAPAAVTLDASGSSDLDGVIAFYEWDFEGDGLYDAFGREAIATHVYNHAGTFVPLVRVTDNLGAWAIAQADPFTVTEVLQPNMPPVADIVATVTSGPAPLSVGFMASGSSDPDGYIAKYEWDFDGDGEFDLDSGADPTVIHEYASAGNYTATVRVTDDRGDTATDAVLISVASAPLPNEPPVAMLNADPPYGDAPLTVSLDASGSYDPDGSIVMYEWDFDGDGNWEEYGTNSVVEFESLEPGPSTVILRVTDDRGAMTQYVSYVRTHWPEEDIGWSTYGHDVQQTGRSPHPGPRTNEVKWIYDPIVSANSTAAMGLDGSLYVGGRDGKLYAVAHNYGTKWAYDTGGAIVYAPVIDGAGAILVVSSRALNLPSKVVAVNPDGTLKWTYEAGEGFRSALSIGADGTLYVSGEENGLHALNPDGSFKWLYTTGMGSRTTPVFAADGTIYIGSYDHYLHAVNPDGTVQWVYPIGANISSGPEIGLDGTAYLGSTDHNLYAINPDGTLKWSYETQGWVASDPICGADGTVYFGSDDHLLYALNPDGSLLWKYDIGGTSRSQPAIAADGSIYLNSGDGTLNAVNADGTEKWKVALGFSLYNSPLIGPDGLIYLGSEYSFSAVDSNGVLRWQFESNELLESTPIAHPDGSVYITGDHSKLYSISSAGAQQWVYKSTRSSPTLDPYGDIYIRDNDGHMCALDTSANLVWKSMENNDRQTIPVFCPSGVVYLIQWDLDTEEPELVALNPDRSPKWVYKSNASNCWMPIIGRDGTVYFLIEFDTLHAINPDGSMQWAYETEGDVYKRPVVDEAGTVYLRTEDGRIHAVDHEGNKIWTSMPSDAVKSGIAIGSDRTIYAGVSVLNLPTGFDHYVYALNPDGTLKWYCPVSETINTPAIGGDGTIYASGSGENVYAINPDGTLLWSSSIISGDSKSPVIGNDGTLYVASDLHLYAFGPGGG